MWFEAKRRYIMCHALQSNQECVLYLHFRSTTTRVSFHTERKSILHTWKQLVMVLLELNLHWIIHTWVIQGEYYLCSNSCLNYISCLFSLGRFTWIRTAGWGPVFAGHDNILYFANPSCCGIPPNLPRFLLCLLGVLLSIFCCGCLGSQHGVPKWMLVQLNLDGSLLTCHLQMLM